MTRLVPVCILLEVVFGGKMDETPKNPDTKLDETYDQALAVETREYTEGDGAKLHHRSSPGDSAGSRKLLIIIILALLIAAAIATYVLATHSNPNPKPHQGAKTTQSLTVTPDYRV